MIYPPFLKNGDQVAIVSPAGKVSREIVEQGAKIIAQQGFVPLIGENAYQRSGTFAGTDTQRASDLQKALNNNNIKAIFFSRGGYGSIRTFELIDWSNFLKSPKWLVGFSDITVFHAFANNNNVASVHGVMPAFFKQNGEITDSFRLTIELLRGELPNYQVKAHTLNKVGVATGKLCGGNLSVIQSLQATNLEIRTRDKILFIEDIGEYNYHIDRMIMNLKAANVFRNIAGLVVGYFTDAKDGETPFGKNSYEIIREAVEKYNFPVVFGFEAGHQLPNFPLLLGGKTTLEVAANKVVIHTK